MIVFGTCVGPGGRYERIALPWIERTRRPDDVVLTETGASSLCSAYNSLIERAAALAGVEALVLLHDDVAIQDPNFHARVRRSMQRPDTGVVGVVGHRRLHDLRYWRGRDGYGRVWDSNGVSLHGPLRGEVDAVDGLLMVLSPEAMSNVRFDPVTFPAFLGYDVDYCLSCRVAGLRNYVEPFEVFHESTGSAATAAFEVANEAFVNKWSATLHRTPVRWRSTTASSAHRVVEKAMITLDPLRSEADHLRRQASRRWRYRHRDTPPPPQQRSTRDDEPAPTRCLVCLGILQPTSMEHLRQCTTCGSLRTWPAPLVAAHSDDIFEHSYGGQRLLRSRRWMHEAAARLSWVESLSPEGVLIDIGAATGEFVTAATTDGYEAYGVEPSDWVRRLAPFDGLFSGTLDEWADANCGLRAHVMTMFHVLEHCPDPTDLLTDASGCLLDGGRLFVEVPNAQVGATTDGWRMWMLDYHHWHFTPTGLTALLERNGFVVESVSAVTERPYSARRQWEHERGLDRRAGRLEPRADLLRAVARRDGYSTSPR